MASVPYSTDDGPRTTSMVSEVLLAPRVVEPQAVLDQQHPLAPLAADLGSHLAGADPRDIQAGHAAEHIGGRIGLQLEQVGGVHDPDGRGRQEHVLLAAGGGDRHRCESHRILRAARRRIRLLARCLRLLRNQRSGDQREKGETCEERTLDMHHTTSGGAVVGAETPTGAAAGGGGATAPDRVLITERNYGLWPKVR
jgi:hypothetical protein